MTKKDTVDYAVWDAQAKTIVSIHDTELAASDAIGRRQNAAPAQLGVLHIVQLPTWRPDPNPHLNPDGTPVEDDPDVVKEQKQAKEAAVKQQADDAKERHEQDQQVSADTVFKTTTGA